MENDVALIKEFEEYLGECERNIGLKVETDEILTTILNLKHEDIMGLSSEEALSYSFKLKTGCLALAQEYDRNRARILWCEEVINRIVGKGYHQYEMMKYEPKRQLIISQDSAAEKVERLRIRLVSANYMMESKISLMRDMAFDLSRMGRT